MLRIIVGEDLVTKTKVLQFQDLDAGQVCTIDFTTNVSNEAVIALLKFLNDYIVNME